MFLNLSSIFKSMADTTKTRGGPGPVEGAVLSAEARDVKGRKK